MVIQRQPLNEKNKIAEFGTISKSENLEFLKFGAKNGSKKLEFSEQFRNSEEKVQF